MVNITWFGQLCDKIFQNGLRRSCLCIWEQRWRCHICNHKCWHWGSHLSRPGPTALVVAYAFTHSHYLGWQDLDILGDFLCFLCGKGWTGGILVTSIVSNGKGGCVNQGSHNDSKGVNIELPVLPALSLNKLEVCDPTCWYSVPSSKSLMMKRHSSSLEMRNQLSVILNIRASAPLGASLLCTNLSFVASHCQKLKVVNLF